MHLHETPSIDLLLKLIYLLLIAGGVWLFFHYIFGWVLPLIIAYLLSRLIQKPVAFLQQKCRLPRNMAAFLCTILTVGLLSWVVYFVLSRLFTEAFALFQALPAYLDDLPQKLDRANLALRQWAARWHLSFIDPALLSFETLLAQIKPPSVDVTQILSTLGSAATGLPSVLLTLAFILLGTYFMSGEQSKISGFLAQCLGEKGTQLGRQLRAFLYESVGKWLRAQCILVCITFCELSVGFFLLKLPYAGLLALLIAFIDALPILGAGAVLLPWALFSFLLGQKGLALGLGLLYAVMLLVRSLLEPRIVGAQLGLDPFVTLLCIYFGFRIAGFAGMFILPVVVLTTFKLREWGYVSLERNTGSSQGKE